jgi:hypothetical protein
MPAPTPQLTPPVNEKELVLSGGFGTSSNSARAGYLPVSLERIPLKALRDVEVYIRSKPDRPSPAVPGASFRLYCGKGVRFAELHRRRLSSMG